MTHSESIVLTFCTLWESTDSTELSVRVEDLTTTGKDLVSVGLVTYIPNELITQITDKAQGNPFYIEELVNFFHDRGLDPQNPAVPQHLDLPDSLHGLILARIDRLPGTDKTALQAASVIGQKFSLEALCRVIGVGNSMMKRGRRLVRSVRWG